MSSSVHYSGLSFSVSLKVVVTSVVSLSVPNLRVILLEVGGLLMGYTEI